MEEIKQKDNKAFAIHGVMPIYFDQKGTELKENDIVFYSEDNGKHEWHYADQIGIIVKQGNKYMMKAKVITMTEAENFIDYDEPEHNMVSLEYGQTTGNENGTLPDFLKIGEYPKDKNMLTKEYAELNYKR